MRRPLRFVLASLGAALMALVATAGSAATPSPTDASEPAGATDSVRVVPADESALSAQAAARVAAMSVRERAAAVVMGHIPTTDQSALRAYMDQTDIGGFILMGANIPGDEAALRGVTAALTLDPALPPLIGIDEEGGDVSRLPWDDFPGALTLKSEDPAATEDAFAGRAALLARAGISVNFGIVADVTDDRSSFIYRRALGTTPAAAAERVTAAVAGEKDQVASTLKHYPGHGAAPGDSHQTIPTTDMPADAWAAADAVPFAAGIDAGAPILMFGHLVYSAVDGAPASLSAEWHRIAREEQGFTGLAITDDLGMLQGSGLPQYQDPVGNAVASLVAGNDMVLAVMMSDAGTAGRIIDGIEAAVTGGSLSEERLTEAATRVTALRLDAAASGRGLVPCPTCVAAG